MSEAEIMFYFSVQNAIFTSINRDSTNYYVAFFLYDTITSDAINSHRGFITYINLFSVNFIR